MVDRLLKRALSQHPDKSILLLGPRQVGKSTLMRALNPDLELNLAHSATFLEFAQNPKELEQRIEALQARTIFIDEIQKLPSLLDTIQTLIDQPRSKKQKSLLFYLTGSSARKLRRGGANLLPGRVFSYELGPLASSELNYLVPSEKALETGFLPEVCLSSNRKFQEKLLKSYAATYLKEEIQAEALTRQLEGFSRFLAVAAENSGKFLDLTKVAQRSKISRSSCVRFFEILEDTLIVKRSLPCSFVEAANLVKHPRFYFFDVGVLNGILGNFTASADRVGLLAEHLIFNQLNQSACARDQAIEISNFRTRGGLEIDFIVRMNQQIWVIEVKKNASSNPNEYENLKKFSSYYSGKYTSFVATFTSVSKKADGVWILPWQKMLQEMGL